jgi:hypothetical protein
MQLSKGVLLMKEIRRGRLLKSQQVFIREVKKCAALWSRTDIHRHGRPLQTLHSALRTVTPSLKSGLAKSGPSDLVGSLNRPMWGGNE